jgi:hypothetical protein
MLFFEEAEDKLQDGCLEIRKVKLITYFAAVTRKCVLNGSWR